jgi:hypothetical protein
MPASAVRAALEPCCRLKADPERSMSNRSAAPHAHIARALALSALLVLMSVAAMAALKYIRRPDGRRGRGTAHVKYAERRLVDTGGFAAVTGALEPWPQSASLEQVSTAFHRAATRSIDRVDEILQRHAITDDYRILLLLMKSSLFHYNGDSVRAYDVLDEARTLADNDDALAQKWLYTIIYVQGVASMRQGENDNCIRCRGESSCIVPIVPAAVHGNPTGSRRAIKHFTEYLEQFPDDVGIRWLLNVAHMTLGEYPLSVDPRYLMNLDRLFHSEFDIGKFRDVGDIVGVNRLNQSGGAIMDDFDNDGLLDVVVTCADPRTGMRFYRNNGDGTFQNRTESAGLAGERGGLVCYQTDYNNDGRLDIFIARGAWLPYAVRPSLLRNDGDGAFTDVTAAAGLLEPVNSNASAWADYDNDGWLDLLIACEKQPNRLYHNRGDGTFEDVAARAGVAGTDMAFYKGCTWIDYDNDRYPDLFLNPMNGIGQLFHNDREGTFTNVNGAMSIDGPRTGFSCWAWDYDNDGWLDIFATSFDRSLTDVARGLVGRRHARSSPRLFHNLHGKNFENVTERVGLDMVFSPMGSNFGDFDNDGWLDFYLGTGDPDLGMLVPNRMFKNVGGARFAEITGTSGTGHLQKGHAVACGDWDHDGNVDIFIEMGGATDGDKYHNILFQNPGQGNNWLTIKLKGARTNRAAIGARIMVVTAAEKPLALHRYVSSGSSFGANTLRQTIGLGKAERVAVLKIDWPTSGTTQVFRDIPANQMIEITEFESHYRKLKYQPIPLPAQSGHKKVTPF